MPTYEYACKVCKHAFEKFQLMSEKAIKKCPKCGKMSAERLISSGAGFLFKGSGFYQTDYRSKSYQEKAKTETPSKESPPKESSEGGEKGSSEKKPPQPSKKTKEERKS